MKNLTYIAEVNNEFVEVNSFFVRKSWQTLIDTAEVKLKKRLTVGDRISLLGGYNDYKEIFSGFVVKVIEEEDYFRVRCEDENYILKLENLTLTFPGGSLKEFLEKIEVKGEPNIKATISKFRITNATKLQVLNKLKEQGIHTFIRHGKRIIGLPYKDNEFMQTIEFIFSGAANEVIEKELNNEDIDLTKLVIEGVNIKKDNSRESYFAFWNGKQIKITKVKPKDGQIKTLYFYELTELEISKRLREYLTNKIKTGLTGNFTTFVHKIVFPEDIVILKLKDGDHKCYVKEVEYSFSFEGGRQTIKLDYEL